ncbi:MAG: hypothetical protein WCH41_05905 [Methylophilaceae bacterium]
MNKNTDVEFSIAKQSRSEKTLDDLLDAADHLVAAADPKAFTARSLSEKSGYALGTLVNRLQSVENVFLLVIEKQRDQHIQAIVKIIEEFDKDKPIQELSELITENAFATFKKVNPKVIQYIESRLIKREQFSSKYFHYLDPIAGALFLCSKKNTSNTFREVTEHEAKLIVRSFVMIGERPFVEDDPIAGSKEHRRITVESIVRLFGK